MDSPYLRSFPAGHFYNPLPNPVEASSWFRRIERQKALSLPGISLDAEQQFAFLTGLSGSYLSEFQFPDEQPKGTGKRYYFNNSFFGAGDAFLLYAMLRKFSPKKIIEVGSGFSSALMLDVRTMHGLTTEFQFIEPYPERLRSLLTDSDSESCEIMESGVQDVPLRTFESLSANDILFIDSSHVSKIGSDVNYLFFEVIPRLASGVIIHVHDIFWPFEYPESWHKEGRAWNEAYLLRASLINNRGLEVLLFPDFLKAVNSDRLIRSSRPHGINSGGSIWLVKKN